MTKVELIVADDEFEIQYKINDFLEDNKNIKVKDIKWALINDDLTYDRALIIYEVNDD